MSINFKNYEDYEKFLKDRKIPRGTIKKYWDEAMLSKKPFGYMASNRLDATKGALKQINNRSPEQKMKRTKRSFI